LHFFAFQGTALAQNLAQGFIYYQVDLASRDGKADVAKWQTQRT
jgi:hypothetical protein